MNERQDRLREKVEELRMISSQPRVAIRMIELSRDESADFSDYTELIETDPGLASAVLALANSAWFAPRIPIETVSRAASQIGLSHLRVVALGHCVASVHRSLSLDDESARCLWAASMCKAIAARAVATSIDPERAAEAFTAALLQDIGLSVLVSVDAEAMHGILSDSQVSTEQQQGIERTLFGSDHSAVGASISNRWSLPGSYVESISRHHESHAVDLSTRISSLFPHDTRWWKPSDAKTLEECLPDWKQSPETLEEFIQTVDAEFETLDEMLNGNTANALSLVELLSIASEENSANTARLVGQVHKAHSLGEVGMETIKKVTEAQRVAEERAQMDSLTGILNRFGLESRASVRLAEESPGFTAVVFFDFDHFKDINDSHGHEAGDAVLVEACRRLAELVRPDDLLGRWGGDEIVLVLRGLSLESCTEVARRIKEGVEERPVDWRGLQLEISLSAGFYAVPGDSRPQLAEMVRKADEGLLEAKRTQRGTMVCHIEVSLQTDKA